MIHFEPLVMTPFMLVIFSIVPAYHAFRLIRMFVGRL